MDHLCKVRKPIRDPVVVPFICADFPFNPHPLSLEGFEGIPRECGYGTHDLIQGVFDHQKITPFLQSWLFFGMLVQIIGPMGVVLSRDEFVRSEPDGTLVITTESLPKYLWFWLAVRIHIPRHDIEEHTELVDSCLALANAVLNGIISYKPNAVASSKKGALAGNRSSSSIAKHSTADKVLLSLVVLGETLSFARKQIVRYNDGPTLRWEHPAFGITLLQEAGWCNAEISSLLRYCGPSGLYYLSTWDRVILKKDHSRCEGSRSCQAHQLNPKTYKTQHVTGCLGCEEYGFSSQVICKILIPDRTVIPIVTVDFRRRNAPLEILAADITRVENVPLYVAISHVWSDGKGNLHRNFLPSCQLQRMQDCANALYPLDRHPVPFWMDTLCVPVGREFWPIRNRALNHMKATYKSADKTLVFDNSLELVDSTVASEESLIRMRYCPWTTRLWTMQEGRLGHNIFFQFRDKSISFDHQPYQGGDTGNLPAVDKILRCLTTQELASCRPAQLLVCALAYVDQTVQLRLSYAEKPPQSDPDEEELRISAIESFEDLKFADNLHKTWLPLAKDLLGESYEASILDDQLLSDIHATIISPIISHCSEGWLRTRGFVYHILLNRQSGTDHFRVGSKPSAAFDDTARGLQGRTTSRIEDEPVCLCALLGLDNANVLKIPVPSFRKKRLLSSVISRPWLATICRNAGLNPQSALIKCHDDRMKAAFQLVDAFPHHIIFWNVPRLREKGWRWAPSTFLAEDTRIATRAAPYAERREEGLCVGFNGWHVSILDGGIEQKKALRRGEGGCVVLVLRAQGRKNGESHPFRRSWMRVRLPGSAKRWRRVLGRRSDWAIIVDEGRGVLVAVDREEDGLVFAMFESAVERVPSAASVERDTVFEGTGRWVEYPKWCIG